MTLTILAPTDAQLAYIKSLCDTNDADRERDNLEAIRYAEAWEAE